MGLLLNRLCGLLLNRLCGLLLNRLCGLLLNRLCGAVAESTLWAVAEPVRHDSRYGDDGKPTVFGQLYRWWQDSRYGDDRFDLIDAALAGSCAPGP